MLGLDVPHCLLALTLDESLLLLLMPERGSGGKGCFKLTEAH